MDPVSLGALATTTVSLLLPYLGKVGESISKKAGEELFDFLKARFEKKPAAEAALVELEKEPYDSAHQQAVVTHVGELLKENPTHLQDLQGLLDEIQRRQQASTTTIQQTAGDNGKQFGQVFGNVSFGKD